MRIRPLDRALQLNIAAFETHLRLPPVGIGFRFYIGLAIRSAAGIAITQLSHMCNLVRAYALCVGDAHVLGHHAGPMATARQPRREAAKRVALSTDPRPVTTVGLEP